MKQSFAISFSLALLLLATASTPQLHVTLADDDRATVVFCDEVDDNWEPVKPVTTIKAGEGVNFLVKLKEGIAVVSVMWDIYKVGADGKDVEPFDDMLMNSSDPDQKFRYWATTEKTYFTTPGRYRVYLYPKNMHSGTWKSGNWEEYSAMGELVVE